MSEGGPGWLVPGPEGPGDQGLGHGGVVHHGLGRGPLQGGDPHWWRRGGSPPGERPEVVTAEVSDLLSTERLPREVMEVTNTDRSL